MIKKENCVNSFLICGQIKNIVLLQPKIKPYNVIR